MKTNKFIFKVIYGKYDSFEYSSVEDIFNKVNFIDVYRIEYHKMKYEDDKLIKDTVLWSSSINNKLIYKLIELGADVHAGDEAILKYAFVNNKRNLVYNLIYNYGASVKNIDNILCDSVVSGNINTVKLVMEFGADPNARDHYPLQFAIMSKNLSMIQFLIAHGATLGSRRSVLLKIMSKNKSTKDIYDTISKLEG